MLMRKVMAEQPVAAAAAEVLLMMLETLEMLVEREDGGAVRRKSRPQEDTGDWRQFFQNNDNVKFKGEEPNFEEEGWARRRPKKK